MSRRMQSARRSLADVKKGLDKISDPNVKSVVLDMLLAVGLIIEEFEDKEAE